MATASAVRFDTHQYEFTYGRGPRGRGSWAFEIDPSDVDVSALKASVDRFNDAPPRIGVARLDATTYGGLFLLWLPSSTYRDAKRLAQLIVRHAVRGMTVISVAT